MVAALLLAGAVATIDGLHYGLPLVVAAAVVLAAFVLQAAALASARHLQVLQVIAQGRGSQIRIVEHERQRLLERECRESIARSLDDLRVCGVRSGCGHGALGPIFKPWVIRAASADLARLTTSVHEDRDPGVRGIAMLEGLLVDGCSPVYGDNSELLQQELRRARFLLDTQTEIPWTGNGGDDHPSAGRRS